MALPLKQNLLASIAASFSQVLTGSADRTARSGRVEGDLFGSASFFFLTKRRDLWTEGYVSSILFNETKGLFGPFSLFDLFGVLFSRMSLMCWIGLELMVVVSLSWGICWDFVGPFFRRFPAIRFRP